MSDSSKRGGSDYPTEPTIVGGRPLGNGRPQRGIPRGIEVLIKKASVDPSFCKVLLEKRASAAADIGLELSAAEIATLDSVPPGQIEQIIENTTVPDDHRRVFLGKIAAAMLATISLGLSGCLFWGRPIDRNRLRTSNNKFVTSTTPIEPRVSHDVRRGPDSIGCIREGREHLNVSVTDNQTNSLTARISYECPFDHGFVKVLFVNEQGQSGKVECRPERATAIKGNGAATFRVEGKGLTTIGVLAGLLNTTDQCRGQSAIAFAAFLGTPLLQPGEYMSKRYCVICRMMEFPKVWPS